jgi:hypothetical protein
MSNDLRHNWPVRFFDGLLWVQGIYYFITGVWPLVSIESFQAVTGRKTDHLVTGREGDHWLVLTVVVLVTAIAIALLWGAWRKQRPIELTVLGFAAAVALTAIDLIYVSRHVIAPIYLVDALAETALAVCWLIIFANHAG